MRRLLALLQHYICAVCLLWLSLTVQAQELKDTVSTTEDARIAKLAPLVYPALARQTGTVGDVDLKLEVRPDGSVKSAVAISGHPLLVQPALDNALKSQFVCESCGENVHSYSLVYTFRLNSPDASAKENEEINPEHPGLRIKQSAGGVLVTDYPFEEIAFGGDIKKVRAIKCLYMWKCGWRERDFERPAHFKQRE